MHLYLCSCCALPAFHIHFFKPFSLFFSLFSASFISFFSLFISFFSFGLTSSEETPSFGFASPLFPCLNHRNTPAQNAVTAATATPVLLADISILNQTFSLRGCLSLPTARTSMMTALCASPSPSSCSLDIHAEI